MRNDENSCADMPDAEIIDDFWLLQQKIAGNDVNMARRPAISGVF